MPILSCQRNRRLPKRALSTLDIGSFLKEELHNTLVASLARPRKRCLPEINIPSLDVCTSLHKEPYNFLVPISGSQRYRRLVADVSGVYVGALFDKKPSNGSESFLGSPRECGSIKIDVFRFDICSVLEQLPGLIFKAFS